VAYETRQVLLGHTTGDITIHYSPAEIQELIEAVEKLTVTPPTVLREVRGPSRKSYATELAPQKVIY